MPHEEEPAHQVAQKINQIIASDMLPVQMLQELARVIGSAFDVDCCAIAVLSNEANDTNQIATANWCRPELISADVDEMFSLEPLDLPVVQCASEPISIEDISTIESSLVASCQNLSIPLKSVLAITTRFAGKNNGVVALIQSQPHEWNNDDKHKLNQLESFCAIAFAHLAQTQLLSVQEKFVQTCSQHQNLIKQLSLLSRSSLELNQMLQLLTAATAEALSADRGLLILLKYNDPLFRIRARNQIPKAKANLMCEWLANVGSLRADNNQDSGDMSAFMLADSSLFQRVFIEKGKPVVINNRDELTDTTTIPEMLAVDKYSAILLMPLESQGRILGFIVLQQSKARIWDNAELNIVEMVCAQVGNAIIQSQTLRQVQMLVDERTAQLQRSLEVQAKLYEKTRQYVEQLRELNELKDEFLSNLSDRLRYPLTNMRMALRNLRQPTIQPDRQARYLDILEQECSKEINLINDLLTLQKLESHQERPQLEEIDLNQRLEGIIQSFEGKFAEKGLMVTLDLPPESLALETEIESFERIFQELLTNASKYSQPDTQVHLYAGQQVTPESDRVIIEITNIGRGISSEEATYIFDKFRRGRGRWTPGTGLGLALVKSLVQHLNGEITVESTPIDEESELSKVCFILTLPRFSDESK